MVPPGGKVKDKVPAGLRYASICLQDIGKLSLCGFQTIGLEQRGPLSMSFTIRILDIIMKFLHCKP